MTNTEILSSLKHLIAAHPELRSSRIAICPFGENGIYVKQVLNECFGIREEYIIDNGFSEWNSSILSVDDLKKKDTNGLTVILASSKMKVIRELLKEIQSIDRRITVYNLYQPVVTEDESRQGYFKKLKNALRVKTYSGHYVRVGKDFDGGYIMADSFEQNMKCYSFGIGRDVSWDKFFAEKNYIVYMYDHTIASLPEDNKNFRFVPKGVSGTDSEDDSLLCLQTILQENGDLQNDKLILKMDVKGTEWDVISHTDKEIWSLFSQIVMEVHGLLAKENEQMVLDCLNKLNMTHQLVYVHGNCVSSAVKADGIVVPNLLELTWLNREKFEIIEEYGRSRYEKKTLTMPNIEGMHDFEEIL